MAKFSSVLLPTVDNIGKNLVQSAVGSFLYFGRAINNTILPLFMQATPTNRTSNKLRMILEYLNTSYKNVSIRFYASDMKLYVDSGAVQKPKVVLHDVSIAVITL